MDPDNDIISLPYTITCENYETAGSDAILFLTESANIAAIKDKNLSTWLTKEEVTSALDTFHNPKFTDPMARKHKFYLYGSYLREDNYILLFSIKGTTIHSNVTTTLSPGPSLPAET